MITLFLNNDLFSDFDVVVFIFKLFDLLQWKTIAKILSYAKIYIYVLENRYIY